MRQNLMAFLLSIACCFSPAWAWSQARDPNAQPQREGAPRGEPGRGGPGFGGPGRGGPGGFGFGRRGGGADAGLALLGIVDVQKELGVTEEQMRKVEDLVARTQEQMRNQMESVNFADLQNLQPDERDKRMEEMRRKSEEMTRAADTQLAKILDTKQISRLTQLRWQRLGTAAFARSEVIKELDITDAQREKMIRAESSGERGGPPFARSREEREKADAEMLALLTDSQKAKWSEMKGKEFAFPEEQDRGFPGRGGLGGGPPGFGGPGGFGGPPGFGGPGGGPGGPGQERKIVAQFDKDGDNRLNTEERAAARKSVQGGRGGRGEPGRGGPDRGGPGGFGPPGGGFGAPGAPPGRGAREPGKPGPKVSPADVTPILDAPLYEPTVLRTLFLEFENADWEQELADFNNTDVEVPATLTVDGKKYPQIGVHFRGMSSFMAVGEGSKRSLNLTLDFVDPQQRLYGYKTLNLLNAHEDASFLHTVLYFHVARNYIPAPKANFVKVVINGESWGVYTNVQQFNKEFVTENYPGLTGTRWKVPGGPGGRGGLEYVGDNIDEYKRRFEMKSDDGDKAWKALANLCRVLNQTPIDQLEAALKPILDIDGALWFLALDNALINGDGYWTRASDYSLFLDKKGVFHVIPHDANETFHAGGGPGMGGPPGFGGFGGGPGREPDRAGPAGNQPDNRGPGGDRRPGGFGGGSGGPGGFGGGPGGPRGGGLELDPLIGLDDSSKPLRSRLLAVPALRERYLDHVRTIAQDWLDWNKLQPVVRQYVNLIEKEVEADTRKLSSFDAFQQAVSDGPAVAIDQRQRGGFSRGGPSLRSFADQRRAYLLNYPEIKKSAAR